MRSLKTLAIAGATTVVLAAVSATVAIAGDLPPPPVPQGITPAPMFASNDSGFYLRGDIGGGINTDGKHSISGTPVGTTLVGSNEHIGGSPIMGIGIGYAANNWLRFDGTLEYRGTTTLSSKDTYTTTPPGFAGTDTYRGNVRSVVGLVNGYVDLGTWNCFTPYIGAGVGFSNNRISEFRDIGAATLPFPGTSYNAYRSGSNTNFAWALMAGTSYDVSSNLKLDFGYRYLNYGKARTSGSLPLGLYTYTQKDLASHDFRLGMRWVFADKGYAAPPPAYSAPIVRKF